MAELVLDEDTHFDEETEPHERRTNLESDEETNLEDESTQESSHCSFKKCRRVTRNCTVNGVAYCPAHRAEVVASLKCTIENCKEPPSGFSALNQAFCLTHLRAQPPQLAGRCDASGCTDPIPSNQRLCAFHSQQSRINAGPYQYSLSRKRTRQSYEDKKCTHPRIGYYNKVTYPQVFPANRDCDQPVVESHFRTYYCAHHYLHRGTGVRQKRLCQLDTCTNLAELNPAKLNSPHYCPKHLTEFEQLRKEAVLRAEQERRVSQERAEQYRLEQERGEQELFEQGRIKWQFALPTGSTLDKLPFNYQVADFILEQPLTELAQVRKCSICPSSAVYLFNADLRCAKHALLGIGKYCCYFQGCERKVMVRTKAQRTLAACPHHRSTLAGEQIFIGAVSAESLFFVCPYGPCAGPDCQTPHIPLIRGCSSCGEQACLMTEQQFACLRPRCNLQPKPGQRCETLQFCCRATSCPRFYISSGPFCALHQMAIIPNI